MTWKIGIDVGGTFTDFILMDRQGHTTAHKELSTPADPSIAVLEGLTSLSASRGLALDRFMREIDLIVHGTTVTTNAVLTGRAAKTALLCTSGFRDALQMRRGVREQMYDNRYHPPPPLVPRHLRHPVTERIDAQGQVVTPLDEEQLQEVIALLQQSDIEAVAVCLMHAYANADHESAVATRLRKALPTAYVSVSSEVLPQVRFYERTSTTVLNAAVGPILSRYLAKLSAKLASAKFSGTLLIMQSNGGVAPPAAVAGLAAMTLLSGPAAAPAAGLALGLNDFITVDMGGTSFEAALVRGGEPSVTTQGTVNHYALALPSMEINTIGAGGGSIAWIDDGGLLRMGPQSAGADPGPACYGRGGQQPTCTDANLMLGYLSADFFAGGRMRLDEAAARQAISSRIAEPLGMEVAQAAAGMIQVINVNMASAIREVSIQKGHDPREFPLVCAGGAGPIHGAAIANELGMKQIIVARDASIFCASGMLRTDLKRDYVRSLAKLLAQDGEKDEVVAARLAELEHEARQTLRGQGIPASRQKLRYAMDLRYVGQYHEVTVEISARQLSNWAAIRERFHAAHDRLYGYCLREERTAIELLNLRVTGVGITRKPVLIAQPRRPRDPGAALKGRRQAYLPERSRFALVPVYDGDKLSHGQFIAGPAIIESVNTTIVVPVYFVARYDQWGSCVLERQ